MRRKISIMKRFSIVLCALIVSSHLFAQDSVNLDALFDPDIVRDLKANGKIQRNFYGEDDISLILAPKTELGAQAVDYWDRDKDPVFIVESLYLLEKNNSNETDSIEEIAKILQNLSKMTGIEYFSTSRQIWEVLYTDVYTVNNPKDKVKIADPIYENVQGLVNYVYQKDRSLSGTVYEFSYFQNKSEVSFRAINTENIMYKSFIFPIVNPENLVLTLIATDVGDSIVFYVLVQAEVPKIPFVSERLARSFTSRADAIYNWCVNMYEE